MDMDMVLDTDMDMASVMLKLNPRLMLIPTFCMEDMEVMAILDLLDMDMDMVLDTDTDMASVRLKLNPRLLLIPTFCMEDMEVTVILDMLDMDMDMVLDTDMDMASVRLKLSPRLMLIPTFCMEDMAAILDMPDIEDMLDTPMVDMPTTDKLTGPRHENGQSNHPCYLYQ